MDGSTDRTLDAVGPRLKQLRQRRDSTLTDLAEETGISTSTLSRLEAGLRRPTLVLPAGHDDTEPDPADPQATTGPSSGEAAEFDTAPRKRHASNP